MAETEPERRVWTRREYVVVKDPRNDQPAYKIRVAIKFEELFDADLLWVLAYIKKEVRETVEESDLLARVPRGKKRPQIRLNLRNIRTGSLDFDVAVAFFRAAQEFWLVKGLETAGVLKIMKVAYDRLKARFNNRKIKQRANIESVTFSLVSVGADHEHEEKHFTVEFEMK